MAICHNGIAARCLSRDVQGNGATYYSYVAYSLINGPMLFTLPPYSGERGRLLACRKT